LALGSGGWEVQEHGEVLVLLQLKTESRRTSGHMQQIKHEGNLLFIVILSEVTNTVP
jgi:hypothetical protein